MAPFALWALGFPQGAGAQWVKRDLIQRLHSLPTYASWGRRLRGEFDAIRVFRNASVHSGFREQDITPATLASYEHLMTLATARVLNHAKTALALGATNQVELVEYLPLVFEANSNVVNDVQGTVIYGLEHPLPTFR